MSIESMRIVWELDLPRYELIVLLALADHAHSDGTKCFPSVAHLATKTGYSRRQIQRLLRSLEAKRVIVAVAHSKGGKGWATEYRLHLENASRKQALVAKRQRVTSESLSEGVACTADPQRAASIQPNGDVPDAKGDVNASPQPSWNHHSEPSSTASAVCFDSGFFLEEKNIFQVQNVDIAASPRLTVEDRADGGTRKCLAAEAIALSEPLAFKGSRLRVSQQDDRRLADTYPWVDREHQYRKANLWLEANPTRRPKKILQFLSNWFDREPKASHGGGGNHDEPSEFTSLYK
jgi:hypothetical protein